MALKLWEMMSTMESGEQVYALLSAKPPKFDIANESEINSYFDVAKVKYANAGGDMNPLFYAGMPTPKLIIKDPLFSPNFFHVGLQYVSARLRSAMQLPEDSVQYIDVDLSECPEPVQAMDYKVINALTFADPYDKERSSGRWVEYPEPEDTVIRVWQFGPISPHAPIPRIYFLEDFVPPAPLFRSDRIGWTLVTDELAERVLCAGITNIGFLDPTNDGTQTGSRWKTLA